MCRLFHHFLVLYFQLHVSMPAMTQNQKNADSLKKILSSNGIVVDARILLRGVGNLVQMLGGMGVLADNIYCVLQSNNIPQKTFTRRQLLVLKSCKCVVRKTHYDAITLHAATPEMELFCKFFL